MEARSQRIRRQNQDQEERSRNPDGLTDAEIRAKHEEARHPDTMQSFDDIRRTLGM